MGATSHCVHRQEQEVESMTTISPLNGAETEWISDLIGYLRDLGAPQDLNSLSAYFSAQRGEWFAAPEDARVDPNPLINAVGAAVGGILAGELGLEWVIATDEYGSEAAVFGQPGDVLLYPMNAVAKRWTGESEGTLADFVLGTIARVREVRAATDRPV